MILLLIVRRVEALGKFLDTEDGKNLLAGYKRATNIIRIEEKKDKREYTGAPDPGALSAGRGEERWRRRSTSRSPKPSAPSQREDFEAAMRAMADFARMSMPSSTRSPSMSRTRRCAKTG